MEKNNYINIQKMVRIVFGCFDINYHHFLQLAKLKDDNISARSLIKPSSSDKSTIDFVVSKPQNNFHSSNTFFAQSSMCLVTF
jgi:hypothetical protein